MPRSRGAVCGLLLVVLGTWGAFIPFVGPHLNAAYTPDQDWAWTTARGWLEVLPGAVAALGGLVLIVTGRRGGAICGAWLALLAGVWFVIGEEVAPMLAVGSVGDPLAAAGGKRAFLEVAYFSGLGTVIAVLGGVALARLAARPPDDLRPSRVRATRAAADR